MILPKGLHVMSKLDIMTIFHQIIEEDIDDPRYHLVANPEKFPKSLSEYKF